MKILVLAGGLSPERDVSLSSGVLIAGALVGRGHDVCLLDVYEGAPAADAALFRRSEPAPFAVPEEEPDLEAVRRRCGGREALIGPHVLEIAAMADVVFIALHGAMGENGQLQAVLDCFSIPYTGTGYAGSLLAMDKDLSKRLMRQSGIATPDWVTVRPGGPADGVAYPCVVKPCGCGSSVGVSMAQNRGELDAALQLAHRYGEDVLVERRVAGREFSVGVLGGEALPPIEIRPRSGFYDYRNKYQAGLTEELCPAPLDSADTRRVQRLALDVHRTLRLGSYSRVDFMLGREGFWCLEANTLPGMTPTSLLPQEAAAAGISYAQLCERIALLALPT